MPPDFRFDQGEVTRRARSDLETGELQQSIGAEYEQGDTSGIWKQRGRTLFGDTTSAAKIIGVKVLKFDSATTDKFGAGTNDQVVALSGTTLYGATPGVTGTFASLKTGLSASAVTLDSAHFNDRHYIVNGFDKMQVLENDKTVRDAGMEAPQVAPIVAASDGGTVLIDPDSTDSSSNVINPDDAWDGDDDTFAAFTVETGTTPATAIYSFAAAGAASRKLKIRFLLAGVQTGGDFPSDSSDWGDVGLQSRFDVTIKFEISENSGGMYTTKLEETRLFAMGQIIDYEHDISAVMENILVRITATYNSGSAASTLRIYTVRAQVGGAVVGGFTHNVGAFWGLSEYDETTGRESPLGPPSKLVTFAAPENLATITGAAVVRNSAATHMRLYRTPDGGVYPSQAGLVGQFVAGVSKIFLDDFATWAFDEQPLPTAPQFLIQLPGSTVATAFPRDTPPPILDFVVRYRGVLAGGSGRALFMSSGRPESWPEVNVITSFPFPENDTLINAVVVGDNLLIGARDLMIVLDGLPVLQGEIFFLPTAKPLSGQPGLAAFRGLVAYSVSGEPRAAWVSHFGVYETNGFSSRKLTSDADWDTKVGTDVQNAVLHYDKKRQVLILAVNNQHALLNLSPEHQKRNGLPKTTWGAPGRISDLASSVISGTHRIYSGHATDGMVYLENNGDTDASNSHDANGTWPFTVQSERKYYGHEIYAATRANLRHSDPNAASQTIELEYRTGHDQFKSDQVVVRTIDLTNEEGDEAYIGRAGEWGEVKLTHTGAARFRIQDLRVVGAKVARAGKVAV